MIINVMKKKEYIKPVVELTQLIANSIILVGSPTGLGIGDPIGGGEGG